MHVAVYLERYRDELPLIGKVTSLSPRGDNSEVELNWYMGCYSGTWKVCMRGRGRAREEWKEIVPHNSIILAPVEFTASMKLKKCIVSTLKEKYSLLVVD